MAITLLVVTVCISVFAPNNDNSFYKRTTGAQKREFESNRTFPNTIGSNPLFVSGQQKLNAEKRAEIEKSRQRSTIRYFARQILGQKGTGSRSIKIGSKLIGFLMSAVDTREPSMVRVLLPQGGESSGVEIERGSVIVGQFNYGGSGDKVFIIFHRLDTASGEVKKITAQALDSRDYTLGVRGEVHSDSTVKLASQIGLSLFAGMADVLTEKKSLGFSQAAKPTVKNGLFQGMSRAAQDQAGRASNEIQSMRDYVVLPEGKEMIIQLTEDFRK